MTQLARVNGVCGIYERIVSDVPKGGSVVGRYSWPKAQLNESGKPSGTLCPLCDGDLVRPGPKAVGRVIYEIPSHLVPYAPVPGAVDVLVDPLPEDLEAVGCVNCRVVFTQPKRADQRGAMEST